jgi:hypothetical protein
MSDEQLTDEEKAAAKAAARKEHREKLAARLRHLEAEGRFREGGSPQERIAARLRGRQAELARREQP